MKHFGDPPVLVQSSSLTQIDAIVENELGVGKQLNSTAGT